MQALSDAGMELQRLRLVLPRREEAANLFLAECAFPPVVCEDLPPLVLFEREGEYSAEAREIFAGRSHA
jgi:tRNA1(Val) A37 N6-methylase TrmN6